MERILVVDDEKQVADFLGEFLGDKGYEVYTANDGLSAIQAVKAKKPHLVLLDIMMPGMGGIDVLKEIKKIDPEIGVIMTTGLKDVELAKRTLDLGAYDYITKPFNLDYLETAVMVKLIDFGKQEL
jgi:DNA-binding response OmpR family regulator